MNEGVALPAQLLAKITKDPATGHWYWTAARINSGYGVVYWQDKVRLAHRVIYEEAIGPIPDGLTIDHLCREIQCVNPDHLQAVTLRENILRGMSTAAQRALQTHCIHGHLFDEANTRHGRNSPFSRECRTCERRRASKSYYKARR